MLPDERDRETLLETSMRFQGNWITGHIIGQEFLKDVSSPVHSHELDIHVVYGFRFAGFGALRIAIAKITFDRDTLDVIETGHTEGTGDNAGLASDAFVLVYDYFVCLQILMACFCRTYFGAERAYAALAGYRDM